MPSKSSFHCKREGNLFLRLNTASSYVFQNDDDAVPNLHSNLHLKNINGEKFAGEFLWPSGVRYSGEFANGCRNGKGKQIWQDGSEYEGHFCNDMRHGFGFHKWKSGEVYEGQFYKDHRHGYGCYTWADGTVYSGTFYLDRKEGYGIFTFANGDKFEGLYKADERFGPGVVTYHNQSHGQEVGIWHREKLLKLCMPVSGNFFMKDHSEYEWFADEVCLPIDLSNDDEDDLYKLFVRESSKTTLLSEKFETSLFAENTALPLGIEIYSKNFEHLPLTCKLKEELDKAFFGTNYHLVKNDQSSLLIATNNTSLMMKIQKHVYKHRHAADRVSFTVSPIAHSSSRLEFTSPSGYLERMSESFIESAIKGDARSVYSLLKSGLVDPNVADCFGSTALIGAAMNCHREVVNLLLDSGANVNQVTDEGTSALTVCHVFYYPVDHFKPNVAESVIQQNRLHQKPSRSAEKKKTQSVISLTTQISTEIPADSKKHAHSAMSFIDSKHDISILEVQSKFTKLLHEKEDHTSDNQKDIETCKSDLKIMKAHRETMSGMSRKESFVCDSFVAIMSSSESETESDSKSIEDLPDDISFKTDDSPEYKPPTFESNLNMIDFDLDVKEELINQTANLLSLNQRAVSGISTRDGQAIRLGTTAALAVWKAEHEQLNEMIKLLLCRGADPNVGSVPFPALFFAVKAGDVAAVELLLNKGAATNQRLSKKLGGLTALHLACGITCPESVRIVELLLNAKADPNCHAYDDSFQHLSVKNDATDISSGISEIAIHLIRSTGSESQWLTDDLKFVDENGRTPLHVACDRDDNYEYARDVVSLLLQHSADPDVIWSGNSPLTLAIGSGNDLCIDELLDRGADASLPLTRGVGNAICAAAAPKFEYRRSPDDRVKLLDKLVAYGANMLAPVSFGAKNLTGTSVDYAHWLYVSDKRIAHTPYHALTTEERITYHARKYILAHMARLLRESAVSYEKKILENCFKRRSKNYVETSKKRFVFKNLSASSLTRSTSAVQDPKSHSRAPEESLRAEINISRVSFVKPDTKDASDRVISAPNVPKVDHQNQKNLRKKRNSNAVPTRKPRFRYCYDCGRSVNVRLTPCSRCREVFYCSRACKMKAWEERHKDECLRVKVHREQSPLPTSSEIAELFASRTLDETMERAKMKTNSIIDVILNQQLEAAEQSTALMRRNSRPTTTRSSGRFRMTSSTAGSRLLSSRKTTSRSNNTPIRRGKYQNQAMVSARTRARVGKDVKFGSTGMTLAELGIIENYSFE